MSSTNETDTRISLLQLAQSAQDSPAWEEVLEYYEPFVRQTLVRMKIKKSEIDDVCQQVLAKLWQGLKNYRRDKERARFRTWLTTLIRSVAIDDYRRRQRVKRTEGVGSDFLSNVATPSSLLEETIEEEWQAYVISLAMKRIKKVFTGKAVEVYLRIKSGETYEEVSESLGITKQSAQVLKSRVNTRLIHEVAQIRRNLELPG